MRAPAVTAKAKFTKLQNYKRVQFIKMIVISTKGYFEDGEVLGHRICL